MDASPAMSMQLGLPIERRNDNCLSVPTPRRSQTTGQLMTTCPSGSGCDPFSVGVSDRKIVSSSSFTTYMGQTPSGTKDFLGSLGMDPLQKAELQECLVQAVTLAVNDRFSELQLTLTEAVMNAMVAHQPLAPPNSKSGRSPSRAASGSRLCRRSPSLHSIGEDGSQDGAGGSGSGSGVQSEGETSGDKESEMQVADKNNMKLVCAVNKAKRALQSATAAKETGPSQLEIARGVQVETIYEFFDPVTSKSRLRKMNDDVLHQRRRSDRKASSGEMQVVASAGDLEVGNDDIDLMSPRLVTMESMPSADSESETTSTPARTGGRFLRRQFTASNTEVVTKWAALVGRVLHAKVLDFAALKNKVLRHQHFQVGSSSSSTPNRMVARMQNRARMVVKQARVLAKKLSKEPDCFDSEWNDPSLISYLFSTEYLDTLMLITNVAAKLLSLQPPMAIAKAPCKIFGDIHGQLRDLLLILFAFGAPGEDDDTHWVFNGDFVDRGTHQVEVIGLLFSLKVLFPDRIWLVRGNHEDRSMNEKYGFLDACNKMLGVEFGPKVFELVQGCFDRLPVACLVQDKILCVHGGIGDGTWNLDDLRTIPRPLNGEAISNPANSWIFNILWSDPIEDGKDADPHVFGVHESPRGGVAAQFAWNITKTFCARNGLSLVVRSHQSKRGSRGFDVMHENMLVRVFSARDYEGHGNDGAVLSVTKKCLDDGHPMLIVRPQVVRSVQKARDEAKKRRRGEAVSETSSGPPSPTTPRAGRRGPSTGSCGSGERARSPRSSPKASESDASRTRSRGTRNA
mmetsp:Transcript_106640/g.308544  ORF Transcript_106640/g.308544 Transcript_106640/m.308544 type:complete len:797 (+) Transcript_106640:52-2442(+)